MSGPESMRGNQLLTISSDTNLSIAFALTGASKEYETTALQMCVQRFSAAFSPRFLQHWGLSSWQALERRA